MDEGLHDDGHEAGVAQVDEAPQADRVGPRRRMRGQALPLLVLLQQRNLVLHSGDEKLIQR